MRRRFERKGLGYVLTVHELATELAVDHLVRSRGELHGELRVMCGLDGIRARDGNVHQARFNLTSTTARGSLAKHLTARAAHEMLDWLDLLEDFCRRVLDAERAGDPIEEVGALPMPLGVATRMDPIMPLGDVTTLYGDGSTGKALALETPIPTPTGWATMGDLGVGDVVYDERGLPTRVIAATPVLEGRPCYRVTFSDGASIIADAEHLWRSETRAFRGRLSKRAWKAARRGAVIRRRPMGPHEPSLVTTRQMAETLMVSGERNHAVRLAEPLLGNERSLPVEPYALGAWLGDGTSAAAAITSADPEIVAEVAAGGTPIRATSVRRGETVRYSLTTGTRGGPTVQGALRELGVLNDKHIPSTYLRAAFTQRLALLQGLMDTDGYVDRRGLVSFTTTSRALADGVFELVASLGMRPSSVEGRARLGGRDISAVWDISFVPLFPVFRLPRKASRTRPPTERSRRRSVVSVDPVPSVPVRCIQVAAASGMFLAGRSMIPTHNSTLAAAIAVSVQTGVSVIPGWTPRKAPVLYLDWEAGRESINRRVRGVAMGANIPGPVTISYRNCKRRGPLPGFAEDLAREIDERGFGLVVVDSVGMASGVGEGGDANETAIRLFAAFGALGTTVLAIDHVNKSDAGRTDRTTRAYGSVYKGLLARATFEIRRGKAADGRWLIAVRNTKFNDADELSDQALKVHHEPDGSIWYERLEALPQEMRIGEPTIWELAADMLEGGDYSESEIAAAIDRQVPAVRSTLYRVARDQHLVERLPSSKKWRLIRPAEAVS